MPDLVGEKRQKRNTHPLLQHRLAASANEWDIIPVNAKDAPPRGWPLMSCSAEAIMSALEWRGLKYMGTAVRITGQLCVIDSDMTIQSVSDRIQAALEDLDPGGYGRTVIRDSGAVSLAIFYRFEQPPRHPHYVTHSYTAHPELMSELAVARDMPETTELESDAKAKAERDVMRRLEPQKVEFYAPGHRGRYFCYEGPHSPGRVYRCWEQAPWNTKVSELPVLPIDPAAFIDMCDKILGEELTRIPIRETSSASVLYDLRPDMKFYPKNGHADTLENLTEGLEPGIDNGIRGCAPWTRMSRSEANCKLFVTSAGRIVLTDWVAGGVNHYMESEAPVPPVELDAETIAAIEATRPHPETLQENVKRSPRRDDISREGTEHEVYVRAVRWMLDTIAYYPQAARGRGGAVSIYPDGEFYAPVSLPALREAMASFGWDEVGPRGGIHHHNPVGGWSTHPEKRVVHGLRMRPELERPLFIEDGLQLVNRYEPPAHPSKGGSIAPFLVRLEGLIPDAAERAWFVNWAALLVQQPHWRMIAVAMVARDNGSGRGLLAEALQLVLGERFVVSMPYANISGGSKFNAEVEGRLLLHVNEAAPPEGHKWAGRNAAREALKDFVEPNHKIPFRVEPKGVDAFYTRAAVSTLIFTNNLNGLPLDEADRRFAVMMNGPQMTPEETELFRRWLDDPANIGALYRHLRDHRVETNKRVFDPYMSPRFTGRDMMIDAGKTDLDHAWEEAGRVLAKATELYSMPQIVKLTRYVAQTHNSDFDALVRKHTFAHGFRIGTKRPDKNWRPRHGRPEDAENDDNRAPVFAFSEAAAKKWTPVDTFLIVRQLDMGQKLVDAPDAAFKKIFGVIDGGKRDE